MAFNVADLQTLFSLKIEDCHNKKLESCLDIQTEREDIVPNLFDEFSNIADTGVFQEPFSLKKYKNLIPKRSPKKKSRKLKKVDVNKNTKLLSKEKVRSCSPSFSIDSAVDLSADNSLLHTQKWFVDTDFDVDIQSNCDSGVCDFNISADAVMKNLSDDIQLSIKNNVNADEFPEKRSSNKHDFDNIQSSITTNSSCSEKSKLKALNKKSKRFKSKKPRQFKDSFRKHKESYMKLLDEQKCIVQHSRKESRLSTINSLSDILLTNLDHAIPIIVEKEGQNVEHLGKSLTKEIEVQTLSNESHFTESLMNMIYTPMKDNDDLQSNPLLIDPPESFCLPTKEVDAPAKTTNILSTSCTINSETLADKDVSGKLTTVTSSSIDCPCDNNPDGNTLAGDKDLSCVILENSANVKSFNIKLFTEVDKIITKECATSPVKMKPRRRFIVQDDEDIPSALLEILNGPQEVKNPLSTPGQNTQIATADENDISMKTDSSSKTGHHTSIQILDKNQTFDSSAPNSKQSTFTKLSKKSERVASDSDGSTCDTQDLPRPSNDFCVNLLNFYCTGLLARSDTAEENRSSFSEYSDDE
ncbi:uncharacterized protein [Clytia hemisphaerica]|uniref:Uncharacterized protein n=1 Tax=Clytia hemisphaerica TaxID=252671 RepID=A0A7M5WJB5_9CNID